jgi:hypothetical protein
MADTEQPELSIERFQALVEAYGADIERFPQRERAGARELLRRDEVAQRLVQAARAFDAVLAEARLELSSSLVERLGAIPREHVQDAGGARLIPLPTARWTWLAAAAAVLLGVLGGHYASEERSGSLSAELSALTFDDDLFDDLAMQEGELP